MSRLPDYCECSNPEKRVKWCRIYCGKPRHPACGVITHITKHSDGLYTWEIQELSDTTWLASPHYEDDTNE